MSAARILPVPPVPPVLAALSVLSVLAACAGPVAGPGPAPAPAPVTPDTCGRGPHMGLAGAPRTALERVLILGQVAVLRPGEPPPPGLRPERLVFEIGPDDRIARVRCG
ncbi:MAG: I78 family peptidase inhibitor [Paracoccaceae bacterium]